MESVLITGASGFIGSFIVEEALKRRFGVWAGIRSTSSKKYLKNNENEVKRMGKYQLDDKGKALIERYHEKNSNVNQDKKSRVKELLKQARNKKK